MTAPPGDERALALVGRRLAGRRAFRGPLRRGGDPAGACRLSGYACVLLGGHPLGGPFTPECRDHFRREPVQLFQCHGEPGPSAMLQTTRSKPG